MDKAALVLNNWANEGYLTEKPLFFGRALLSILSDNKVTLANTLLEHLSPLIDDNINPDTKTSAADAAYLGVWHVGVIMVELASFPPMPRVDKLKLFSILYQRYVPLFVKIDPKLVETLNKIGENTFGYQPQGPSNARPNPMAMLQGLLGGGGLGGLGAGAGRPSVGNGTASSRQKKGTAPGGESSSRNK